MGRDMSGEATIEEAGIRIHAGPDATTLASLGVPEDMVRRLRLREGAKGLLRATAMPGAHLVVAERDGTLAGMVLVVPPDQGERWGKAGLGNLFEIVTLDVARPWREMGVARALLRAALSGPEWEGRIVIAALDATQWDVEAAGLSRRQYRDLLMRLLREVGLVEYATDDPDIRSDPLNALLVRVGDRVTRDSYLRFSALLFEREPRTLWAINQRPEEEREAIYKALIPEEIFSTFGIDPRTFTDQRGNRLVRFSCPPDHEVAVIEVFARPEDADPVYLLKLDATADGELEIGYVIINNPRTPRFDVDRDEAGRPIRPQDEKRRNPRAEEAGLRAGLAPGQTHRGLRLLRTVTRLVEEFADSLGRDRYSLEAKFYHLALLYERYGFGYAVGQEAMEAIHRGFGPGRQLAARLDGSTPFRKPGAAGSVRGRSWAIQDGITGEPWKAPRMVKFVRRHLGTCTAPGIPY